MFWQNHFNEWIFLPGPKLLRFVSTNIFHFGAVGKTFCFSDYAIIEICNIHHRLQSANIRKVSGSILILKIQSCKMGSDITRRLRKHKIRLHKVFYVGDSKHLLIFQQAVCVLKSKIFGQNSTYLLTVLCEYIQWQFVKKCRNLTFKVNFLCQEWSKSFRFEHMLKLFLITSF